MALLTFFLTNRYAQAALAAIAVLVALWGYGAYSKHQGYAKAQDEYRQAELENFKAETVKLTGLSTTLEEQLATMRNTAPQVIKEYHETVIKHPLPAGCIIDPDRLRTINLAIEAANSRKFSRTVPADPPPAK